jgi:hypothetical protein
MAEAFAQGLPEETGFVDQVRGYGRLPLPLRDSKLRSKRDHLVAISNPATFSEMVSVRCTGDAEEGTAIDVPAVQARGGRIDVSVTNEIGKEPVFFRTGETGRYQVGPARATTLSIPVVPGTTLEVVCTYRTRGSNWGRPAHPITVVGTSS